MIIDQMKCFETANKILAFEIEFPSQDNGDDFRTS